MSDETTRRGGGGVRKEGGGARKGDDAARKEGGAARRLTLSARLEMVVSFVASGSRVADVGCDHGYVPIALVERGIADAALAMDVREGPLGRAREHIRLHGLSDKIETRLGDGVSALVEGEADTVIMAGMGGGLIVRILDGGRRLWGGVGHWILSPQSEPERVRLFLQENGFAIAREDMVFEDGKYYVVMDAVRGQMKPLDAAEAVYGPCLIRERHPVLYELLKQEESACARILTSLEGKESEKAAARRMELRKKAEGIRELLSRWREAHLPQDERFRIPALGQEREETLCDVGNGLRN